MRTRLTSSQLAYLLLQHIAGGGRVAYEPLNYNEAKVLFDAGRQILFL